MKREGRWNNTVNTVYFLFEEIDIQTMYYYYLSLNPDANPGDGYNSFLFSLKKCLYMN